MIKFQFGFVLPLIFSFVFNCNSSEEIDQMGRVMGGTMADPGMHFHSTK